MTSQNFTIGPIPEGLRKDQKPWATPEDSFETLINAYQWRGRIIRRQGYRLLGQLDNGTPVMGLRTREVGGNQRSLIAFDKTQAYSYAGGFSPLASIPNPVLWNGADWQFFFTTNYSQAFWATNNVPGLHGWAVTLFAGQTGTGLSAKVNVTSAGNTAAVGDTVYFVNLISGGTQSANNLAFGTVTAINVGSDPNVITIQATANSNGALNASSTFQWTDQVVSGLMLDSLRSITGFDGIRYYATTLIGDTWVNYNPPIDATNALAGALLIFPYRGYLVFLNTWEGPNNNNLQNFPNRARWTQIGTPFYTEPVPSFPNLQTFDPLTMRDDIFGRGGANDAPTNQVIVGAEFIRDILVVYFNKSTWRLRFVNNTVNPFVWERVNVELGSSCTFSAVPMDKSLIAIGNRGIVESDANDTLRMDQKIPDEIFDIRQNNHGLERVYGLRTFESKLIYWTYPSDTNPNGIYPDFLLVYNYETKNWAFFDDCFTCLGYFYDSSTGITWAQLTAPWNTYTETSWNSGALQEGYESIVAGNQHGYVFVIEDGTTQNDPSLTITNIVGNVVTCLNHNLQDESWITLSGVVTPTFDDGVSLNGRNFRIAVVDANNFVLYDYGELSYMSVSGPVFITTIPLTPILVGSVQINVGTLQFTDSELDGNLIGTGGSGTINYITGALQLNFSPPVSSVPVYIRIVSASPLQVLDPIGTTGAYEGPGKITKISNINLVSKDFNFYKDDQRVRLSRIDFYMDQTQQGQFTCNILPDSSNVIANAPLKDNPQSNVVRTSQNPYQIGYGDETIYRLYADVLAQSIQVQLTMSDKQMAVNCINQASFELLAMMFSMRRGGRVI